MNKIEKNALFQKLRRKILSFFLVFSIVGSIIQSLVGVYAVVINGTGNTLSGTNNNFINLSNSGAYAINFVLNGTLDIGDTFLLTAIDNSGATLVNSYLSASGGESSGSLLLNFASSGFQQGSISYSGIVYSGSNTNQIVASGMTLMGVLDTTRPVVTLVGSGTVNISQGGTYSESGATWRDNLDGSGTLSVANSGSVNTTISGSYILEYRKTDTAGNISPTISRTINVIGSGDTIAPIVTITSHANNNIVTGFPTLSGTVSDTGGITSVTVNGVMANLGSGTWTNTLYSLSGGNNTITVVATDTTGNTGSTSIILNRVSVPNNTNVVLSGSRSATVSFATDITATGIVLYGTGASTLDQSATGTAIATQHSFVFTGLIPNTIYYFLVQGQNGIQSDTIQFKTPIQLNTSTLSGSTVAIGSVYLSGFTATGVTFSQSGSLTILSLGASGGSLYIPLNNLIITTSGGIWDGVIQAPTLTNYPVIMSLSGYAIIGTAYQIGNVNTELFFSGQVVTVSINLGTDFTLKNIKIYKSPNQGITYTEIGTCTITNGGDCIFTTNQLSRFAFAVAGDTVPDSFSFSGVSNTELSTPYISNPITVLGINGQVVVSIVGGEYSINNASFTAISGTTNSGDIIRVRTTSSSSNSTTKSAILTVGGFSTMFSTTTKVAINTGTIGGGGGGGGGGSSSPLDICPTGDKSPSFSDGTCSVSNTGNIIITTISTGSFNIPAIIIANSGDLLFGDIDENWAKDYINRLAIRGIIDNVEFYRPNSSLTRAEFLKIVINTTGWPISTTELNIPFSDVSRNFWYAQYVSFALSKGMIQNSTRFRPNDSISRAEATKILITALGITANKPTRMTFVDVSATHTLAKYIEAAVSLNILSGQIIGGRKIFRPSDSMTRSEISKVVVNAFRL